MSRYLGCCNRPKPIGNLSYSPQQMGDTLFAKIRAFRPGPVGVFFRQGEFYVFSESSVGWSAFNYSHPDAFVCRVTRMDRPNQIARKLMRVYEKYATPAPQNDPATAQSLPVTE